MLALAAFSSPSLCQSASSESTTATLRGKVFLRDSNGETLAVGGARIALAGQASLESESDTNGEFAILAVPYGSYTAEVSSPGLKTTKSIEVNTHDIDLSIELKPEQTVTSVVVTADQSEPNNPAPSETISSGTLRDAPNVDDRFESALPLVPGVVRGPDGHVNLKGTRNTQSGALVNSTNVTDPVTGGPAISLPVDVVASVQVVSNPYDPQYGRFTGAVSTVSTKSSDFENFHFSLQNFLPRPRVRDGGVRGIASSTPRVTFTGPLINDRLAITQSFQYRFVETVAKSVRPSTQVSG